MLAQRLAAEAQTKQVEAQTAAIQATIEQRLSSMTAPARKAFSQLQAEQATLLAEAGRCEEEAVELDAVLLAAEGELSRNSFKQRALELQVRARVCECGQRMRQLQAKAGGQPHCACLFADGTLPSAPAAPSAAACRVLTADGTGCVACMQSTSQESMRQLMQRKVELAAAEEASKAPAEEQREVCVGWCVHPVQAFPHELGSPPPPLPSRSSSHALNGQRVVRKLCVCWWCPAGIDGPHPARKHCRRAAHD